MARYTLKPVGPTASFKKIISGGNWVGRIVKMGDGTGYFGVINGAQGKTEFSHPNEIDCFNGVVARHLGFANYAEMAAKNRAIRASNSANGKVRRQVADYVVGQMLRGNFEPLDKVLGLTKKDG